MAIYQNKKNGKWYFRVYADDARVLRRQYKRSGFRTKKEAKDAEIEFINNSKKKKESCNITFEQLWNEYKKHIEIRLKYNSIRTIVNRIEQHALPYFKDYLLTDITPRIYEKWQIKMEEKGFSYKYKSSIHGAIRTMLNYAIKFYDLNSNVASKVGNFSKRNELPKEYDVWSIDEFKTFINCVDDDNYKIFFETLYYTGLRLGESLALTWNDFNGSYLVVNKTLTRNIIDGKKIANSPKTATSNRRVKLNSYLIERLNAYKVKCQKYVGFENNWYIFGCLNPLSTTTVERKKNKYCKLSGIKQIKIHNFRHSHVSLLLSRGVPITVIAKRIGHSDIEMTLNTYSHLLPGDEDKAVDVLNSLE